MDRKSATRVRRRLEFSTLPGEQLWEHLNAICEAAKGKNDTTDVPYAEAEEITEALG
ncbi:MAG: hypothetical protein JNL96_20640 [Planctomycetaceae bacterium]|nr:hypothetical protein [Planctomycetaceae bacterium]